VLYGGWEGHDPEKIAGFAADRLAPDFDLVRARELDVLCPKVLGEFDLLLPIWTFGELSADREQALVQAVEAGLGLVAWHGHASAFLGSRAHKWLLGGQFVGHPGGKELAYTIRFLGNDPLVDGLEPMRITSEQYYVLVDPAVKVLATSRIDGAGMDWLADVEMPVAWTRRWGRGRVFYCSLGHDVAVLERAPVRQLLRRAVLWASRRSRSADRVDRLAPRRSEAR
jgi:type 1 glutamine amidotransferase